MSLSFHFKSPGQIIDRANTVKWGTCFAEMVEKSHEKDKIDRKIAPLYRFLGAEQNYALNFRY